MRQNALFFVIVLVVAGTCVAGYKWLTTGEKLTTGSKFLRVKPLPLHAKAGGIPYPKVKAVWRRQAHSKLLNGWAIIIDPGHGHIAGGHHDPGAIAHITYKNGWRAEIWEASIVYDTSLRLARALMRDYGAKDVILTRYALGVGIREKYNPRPVLMRFNYGLKPKKWQQRLRAAKTVVAKTIRKKGYKNILFISIHADKVSGHGARPLGIYIDPTGARYAQNKKFAHALARALPGRVYIKNQQLGVLRNNPAKYELLLELGNMAHRPSVNDLADHRAREKIAKWLAKAIAKVLRSPL
jgi:N-acetylmuramoyl-L-alanine amidase